MRWLRENWLDFLIFVLIAVVAVGTWLSHRFVERNSGRLSSQAPPSKGNA